MGGDGASERGGGEGADDDDDDAAAAADAGDSSMEWSWRGGRRRRYNGGRFTCGATAMLRIAALPNAAGTA